MEEEFIINLKKIKNYIDINNKRPSQHDNDKITKTLGQWISTEITNYRKKQNNMINLNINKKWTEFINSDKYKKYFIVDTIGEKFISSLNKVKKYIDINNKIPSQQDNDKNITILANWIITQQYYYNNKIHNMKDEKIYNKWTEFINSDKYKIYFQSQCEYFIMKLINVKTYIDKNNKRPPQKDKDENIRVLGIWICAQIQNYNKKQYNMKDENIYKKWTEFINDEKYKKYFKQILIQM
jgi:hypothetical protein